MFGLLGLIWGSSFLLIKIGLTGVDPFVLVAGRLSLAAIAFVIFIVVTRRRFPHDLPTLITLAVVGLGTTAFPFLLITWGENTIDSGLAGVLDATTPLFSLVIAHLMLEDDKITLGKLLGLITGFTGIILLATRSSDPTHPNPLAGQLAVIVASISYGASAVATRRYLRHVDPMIVPCSALVVGAVVTGALALLVTHPLPTIAALESRVILSIVGLAVVNTFIAYMLYFTLIANWGASRATMVTYLIPPTSILLGVLVASEPFDWKIAVGTILIVGGVGLATFLKGTPGPVAAEISELESAKFVE